MSTQQIITWLNGDSALREEARRIAKGRPIPPSGEVFEYGDNDLKEFVFEVLFAGDHGEFVFEEMGIDLRHLDDIRDDVSQDDVYGADWEAIRKNLLRQE